MVPEKQHYHAIILGNEKISEEGRYLRFRRDFDFAPGQVIGLTLREDLAPRLYSIASGAHADHIGILYNVKPGGELTPALSELREGDVIQVTPPDGSFSLRPGKSWWIATGTGIAPFLSWMRSGCEPPDKIIFGARRSENIYFREELKTYAAERLHTCVSGEAYAEDFPGRVTDFLAELSEIPSDTTFYLCGLNEMVIDVRDFLLSKGIPPQNIIAEIYF